MSWWIPAERMTNDLAVLPSSAMVWSRHGSALMTLARERLTSVWRAPFTRSARLLRRLLRGLAGVSARMTRALERAADRLDDAEVLPAEWLVADDDQPGSAAGTPPPIPAEARRPGRLGEYPLLVTDALMGSRPSLAPRA
jgi:hypothetical protein